MVDVMSTQDVIQLGFALDAHGFDGHELTELTELTLRRLVREARAAGYAGPAADVLVDATAPDVARLRAFAVVSSALVGPAVARPQPSVRTVA
jgi:hypothetical protein